MTGPKDELIEIEEDVRGHAEGHRGQDDVEIGDLERIDPESLAPLDDGAKSQQGLDQKDRRDDPHNAPEPDGDPGLGFVDNLRPVIQNKDDENPHGRQIDPRENQIDPGHDLQRKDGPFLKIEKA